MNDEEKKAIDKLSSKKNETTWYDTIRQIKREEITDVVVTRQKYITIILNLIEKQQKEIEKKDKIINEMAIELEYLNNEILDYYDKLPYAESKKRLLNISQINTTIKNKGESK